MSDDQPAAPEAPKHRMVRVPIFAALFALLLFVMGLTALVAVPLEQAPEITVGVMIVNVVYPGAGPEDIEREVTRPLEQKLRAVRNVEWLSSSANTGVSVSTLRFIDGADMDLARRDVKRAVDLARVDLPEDAKDPVTQEVAFDDVPIIYVSLSGPTDPVELRELGEDLRDELETIPGVSDVEVFGGAEREVRVRVDPERLRGLSLDLSTVAAALARQSRSAPAGTINVGSKRSFLVRTIGAYQSLDAIGRTVIPTGRGAPVLLRDVATITVEPERRTTDARSDGEESVTLLIRKEKGVSTIPTAEAAKVAAIAFGKERGVAVKYFLEQKRYIERMLRTLSTNALGGMILVLLVLTVFLGFRLGSLIAMAIPVSLITAVIGLWILGEPLSGVAVFGLVLVLGMVVDGAIVVGEVIDRHWREGASPPMAADRSLTEVGRPIIAAAMTTMAAFVPMIFMPGVSGQFMGVLPKVVTMALIGSLFADHILVPAAFAFISRRTPPPPSRFAGKMDEWGVRVIAAYEAVLAPALRRSWLIVVGCGVAVFLTMGLVASGGLGFEFFPRSDSGVFWVDLEMPPGTQLERTSQIIGPIEDELGKVPFIESRVTTAGDSGRLSADVNSQGTGGIGPEYGRVNIELVGPMDRDKKQYVIVDELRKRFELAIGSEISVTERQDGPPQGAPVAVRIKSDEFEDLRSVSAIVEQTLKDHPGSRSVTNNIAEGRPEFRVELRRAQAGVAHGVTAADVARTLQLAVFGVDVADFVSGDDSLDVRLTAGDGRDLSLESLRQLPLKTVSGSVVPLEEVADLEVVGGFQRIIRRNFARTVTVRSNVAETTSSDELRDFVKKKMAAVPLPDGVKLEYAGDNVERDRSFVALLQIYPIALVLIFIILVAQFGSFVQPVCVVAMIPLSFLGSVIGLAVTGKPFGFMAGIGLVALSGIVVNDAIVMVDAVNAYRDQGYGIHEACVAAGKRRFRAVWLTTLTTFFGLSPFAFALTDGAEFWQPLAIVICSGLLSTTILILLVLPGFYTIIVPLTERIWSAIKRILKLGTGYDDLPTGT